MIENVLAALGVVLNGIPQGLLALGFGFSAFPSALAFIVGVAGAAFFGSVAPISFQAETITVAGKMSAKRNDMLTAVFYGGLGFAIIGLFGYLETLVQVVGPNIVNAMMAGVGVMLALVAIDLGKNEKVIGVVSILSALLIWIFTASLVHTIVWSVLISCIVGKYFVFDAVEEKDPERKLKVQNLRWKFWESPAVIRGILALITLNIGATISFGSITGQIANTPVNLDHLAIYSAFANMASSLFGGAPVESIISATGDAPNPVFAGILMMALFALVLLAGWLPKIGKYVPKSSISGFLLVLGAIVTFPINIQLALQDVALETPMAAVVGVTVVLTAKFDPFIGLASGVVLKTLFAFAGVM